MQVGLTPTDVGGGWVYAIGSASFPGRIKIGRTYDPDRRLSAAQTWCPEGGFRYELLVRTADPVALESLVHQRLRDCRLAGEWFNCTPARAKRAIMLCMPALDEL